MDYQETKNKLDKTGCGMCLAKWTQVTIHFQMDKYRKLLGKGNRIESPCNKCDASGIIHGYNHLNYEM
jgi:hypothetical protein